MTVARGDKSQVDALVVVVEPYPRSVEVGRRLLEMAEAKSISRRIVVANKVADGEDLQVIRAYLGAEPLQTADKHGENLLDVLTRLFNGEAWMPPLAGPDP